MYYSSARLFVGWEKSLPGVSFGCQATLQWRQSLQDVTAPGRETVRLLGLAASHPRPSRIRLTVKSSLHTLHKEWLWQWIKNPHRYYKYAAVEFLHFSKLVHCDYTLNFTNLTNMRVCGSWDFLLEKMIRALVSLLVILSCTQADRRACSCKRKKQNESLKSKNVTTGLLPLKYQGGSYILWRTTTSVIQSGESKYNACSHTWVCFCHRVGWLTPDKVLSWSQSVSLRFSGSQWVSCLRIHTYIPHKTITGSRSAEVCLYVCVRVFVHNVWAKTAINHFVGHVSDIKWAKFPLWTNSFTIYCWLMT